MTKPEQLLKLAQIVEPDKEWFIIEDSVRAFNFIGDFDPENDPAQLMRVVFALLAVADDLTLTKDDETGFYEASCFVGSIGKTLFAKEMAVINRGEKIKTKEQAIINLAIKVLLQ